MKAKTLHILNGAATTALLNQTNLSGDRLTWREALAAGPAPSGLQITDWINMRAAYLAESSNRTFSACKQDLTQMYHTLSTVSNYREVTLWFEFDLFCQVNLIYILYRLFKMELPETKLSLICINTFPGIKNFRGLGQLAPEQFVSLFDKRQLMNEVVLQKGAAAWEAYSAPAPSAIEKFLQQNLPDLPFLSDALKAHLERFPSTYNGLGRLENSILELIAGGIDEFPPLFAMIGELDNLYGFGDLQIWETVMFLSRQKKPVIQIQRNVADNESDLMQEMMSASFQLTDFGKEVYAGKADFLEQNSIDYWIGGMHLQNNNVWRWDEKAKKLLKIVTL